ncbi:hypothetical protein [uncultured Roseovarius sp.]|uniref:hypothetical protein n=1 Tax=uncultured Roseovarius sp. TaxID=293344 RepID=UPI002614E832|nr:hypothetical protein [uncultured Roseovarius sp.]
MKLTSATLISTLAMASCTTYVGQTYSALLGDDLLLSGGSYSSGGGITLAAEFREKDGRTLLCGAWAQSKEQSILTKGVAKNVLASGAIYQGRDRVAQGLSFMQEVAPTAEYTGSDALCRLTERPWKAGDDAQDFTIRLPRKLVYQDVDDLGGGIFVYFTQTGPGAGSP